VAEGTEMMWVLLGVCVVNVGFGVAMLVHYRKVVRNVNIFLKDIEKVLNTGRGWEKRWKVCQEMFARRSIGGNNG
jgi:hypothetical protein